MPLDNNTLFSLSSNLALLGWLTLAFVPWRTELIYRITGIAVPGLLSVFYGALMVANFATVDGGGYGSLDQVRALFSNDNVLLAGWIHYLAFDLAVGTWIARQATELGISRFIQIPILLATLMFGPAGFLLFIVTQAGWTRIGGLRREPA